MSQENVDLALALADAFNHRDWDRFVALEGATHGHEGLRRWWENFLGAFPAVGLRE